MKITVAICTWNRAKLLEQTLRQMLLLKVPPDLEWELLVVNNNCSDDTDDVIARYQALLPLRRLFEPAQGHSNARNRAIDEARGELIVWTDDDVLVPRDWLEVYWDASRKYADAVYFGGPVAPWYHEKEPPAWVRRFADRHLGALALADLGPCDRPLKKGEYIVGANMAIRAEVFGNFRFDTTLGRLGTALRGYDETQLFMQLHEQGALGYWLAGEAVRHYIPASRLTPRFWKDFYGWNARVVARNSQVEPGVLFLGAPRRWVRNYWQATLRTWLYAPLKSRRWYNALLESARWQGKIDEFRERAQNHVDR